MGAAPPSKTLADLCHSLLTQWDFHHEPEGYVGVQLPVSTAVGTGRSPESFDARLWVRSEFAYPSRP